MKVSTMLNTEGNKFWERIPSEVKFSFLLGFERWKDPMISIESAFDKAKINEMFTWSEFDLPTQNEMLRFVDKVMKVKEPRK